MSDPLTLRSVQVFFIAALLVTSLIAQHPQNATKTASFNGTQTRTVETDYPNEFGAGATDPTTSTELPVNKALRVTTSTCPAGQWACGTPLSWSRSTYDGLGRRTGEERQYPGTGPNEIVTASRFWTYNALGWKLSESVWDDSNKKTVFSGHDRFGRVGTIQPPGGNPSTELSYDGDRARFNDGSDRRAGKLVLAKRFNWVDILAPLGPTGSLPVVITEAYEYKGRDGAVSKQQTRYHLNNTTYAFETSFGYDPLGNVDEITYPQCLHHACAGRDPPRQVRFNYQRGFLREVEGFANYIAYQSGGMLRRVPHGNVSDWIDVGTDGLARPYKIRTEGVVGGDWDSGAFIYDGAQNIQSIGGTRFAYDRFSRMIRGDVELGNGQIVTQEAYYDGFGNVQKLVNNGVTQWASTSSANNHLTIGGAQYDTAGNLTDLTIGSITYSYDYDPFNLIKHLRSSDDESRVFIYNARDERILTFDCAANVCANSRARETWTLRGLDGKVLRIYEHPWDRDWSWQRDYVYRDGQLLAAVEANQIHHFHLDHLGTPRLVTDVSGNRVAFHAYYPFGLEATDPSQSEFQLKFTGHERDENGPGPKGQLDYMMARYCSPVLGRFYSVDPGRDFSARAPQSWNRYAYTRNNPIKYIDPDGERLVAPSFVHNSLAENTELIEYTSSIPIVGKPLGFALGLVLPTSAEDLNASMIGMAIPSGPAASKIGASAKKFFSKFFGKILRSKKIQQLTAPAGRKLSQQIARFRAAGGTGGRAEFLEHVNNLAARARKAGNVVTGKVGRGPQALPNATIFREGKTFVVVDEAGMIRSFVPNANRGGIADEFVRLGGSL